MQPNLLANVISLLFRFRADIALIGLAVMGQNLILNMNDHGFVVSKSARRLEPPISARTPLSTRPRAFILQASSSKMGERRDFSSLLFFLSLSRQSRFSCSLGNKSMIGVSKTLLSLGRGSCRVKIGRCDAAVKTQGNGNWGMQTFLFKALCLVKISI